MDIMQSLQTASGDGGNGQLGIGSTYNPGVFSGSMGDNLVAADLGADFVPVSMSMGRTHLCFVSLRGEMKCFGRNIYGALGYEDAENRGDESGEMGDDLPVLDLGTNFNVSAVSCGRITGYHCCAADRNSNEKWKCWGYGHKHIFT